MKKHNLFKIISLVFLLVVVLTWIIPTGYFSNGTFVKEKINPIGVFDLSRIFFMTIANLLQYGFIIIMIGGLYGVLNKTGAYANLIEKLTIKLKGKEKIFLIINISILTILSSILGLPYAFLIIVPFLITIILKLGFNKITAFMSTIGAILTGHITSIYGSNIASFMNKAFSLSLNDELFTKIIFLIITTFLLITFVLKESKKEKLEEIPLYEKNAKKKSFVPLIVIFLISFIFLIINMFNWESINVTYFSNLYENLFSNKIVSDILGNITSFGNWTSYDMCIFLVFVILIIGWVYSIKFDDIIDGFINGAKKVLTVALYAIIANIIFVIIYGIQGNSNIFNMIVDLIFNICDEFKTFAVILISIIGSVFFNDLSNLSSILSNPIQNMITDTTIYQMLSMIISSIHGILMFIMPTSILLVIGLSYLDISYKEWFKYIWKFLIQISFIACAIILIVAYIV